MSAIDLGRAVLAALWLGGCAPQPESLLAQAAAPAPVTGYKAVLVAGDGSLPVFDDAVAGVRQRLLGHGASAADIVVLSAVPAAEATVAARSEVLHAIATMRPGAGQGCFVFATSHGGQGKGLWLQATREFLTPADLDGALATGCGAAPTAVVISGCFTGSFAQPPMTRPNRVVLTAARADRPSFGCGAGREYTVYDKCLLGALDAGGTWAAAYAAITDCVGAEERRQGALPSGPQAWFGRAVASLALPGRP